MRTIAVLVASCALLLPISSLSDTGDLDPTFGTGGTVLTSGPPGFIGWQAVVQQADGKLVAGGILGPNDGSFGLARYEVDGDLDPSFDGDGLVLTDVGEPSGISDLALQPDGKIVAVGNIPLGNAGASTVLARYDTDGTLDTSFDGDGIVQTAIFPGAIAAALQPDGKIVVAVYEPTFTAVFRVVRFASDGTLDTTFDGDGIVTTSIGLYAAVFDVALQADGKIVVAGMAALPGEPGVFALARYDTTGALDPTFDGDGIVTTIIGDFDAVRSVAIQGDGKIMAAGGALDPGSGELRVTLVRYDTSGALDPTFDGDGVATSTHAGAANGLILQSDGKPVVTFGTQESDVVVARFHIDGSPDPSFYCGNSAVVTPPGDGRTLSGNALVLQSDGKPVVAGGATNESPFASFGLVMRFGGTPTLADHFVVPKKLVVVDKLAASSGAKAVYTTRDPSVSKGNATNVEKIRARLDLAYQGGTTTGAFTVGCGTGMGWLVNKDTVAKFVNTLAPSGPTESRVVVLKPGVVAKLVGRGLGEEPFDILGAGAPAGSVFASFEVTNDTERHRHCSEFPACVWTSIAAGTGAKLVCRGGVPDPSCQAAAP